MQWFEIKIFSVSIIIDMKFIWEDFICMPVNPTKAEHTVFKYTYMNAIRH